MAIATMWRSPHSEAVVSAQIIPSRTPVEVALAETFALTRGRSDGAAVMALRDAAFERFAAAGLPHRRVESWHYTDLRSLMRQALPTAAAPSAAAVAALRPELDAAGLDGPRLVLVDGHFVAALSTPLPQGATVQPLAAVLASGEAALLQLVTGASLDVRDPIFALNAALMQDGVVVDIAPGAEIETPIHVVQMSASAAPVARFGRSLVRVGAGAKVAIAEWSLGAANAGQVFDALILAVGDGARVRHTVSRAATAAGSLWIESFLADLGAGVDFDSFALLAGDGVVRRQMFVRFGGARSKGVLGGVSLLRHRTHADTTLFVDHVGEGCESRETFRHILDEGATGVFQGKLRVAPGAQKTDGKMMSRALLLSEDAAMNNKPELEIFADDVACGHGATCGGLNEEQIFYLRSRGIPRAEAEALLLEAFAAELVDAIGEPALVARLRGEVSEWLGRRARD